MPARDYEERLRDPDTQRLILIELQGLSEPDKLIFIIEMLDISEPLGLRLANSCLHDKHSLRKLFRLGITRIRDLSQIDIWLKYLINKLGVRQTIYLLQTNIDNYPIAVQSALYFLPSYIMESDSTSRLLLEELRIVAANSGILLNKTDQSKQMDSDHL